MTDIRKDAKENVDRLYNLLAQHSEQPRELLDILDVLQQAYKKIETVEDPALLVSRLVNYIRSVALAGRLHFSKDEESHMIELGTLGNHAGMTGAYGGFSDKSFFYSYDEPMPKR